MPHIHSHNNNMTEPESPILAAAFENAPHANSADGMSALLDAPTNTTNPDPRQYFYCNHCRDFLPTTQFYPSSIKRRIHSCRWHTNAITAVIKKRKYDRRKELPQHLRAASRVLRVMQSLATKNVLQAYAKFPLLSEADVAGVLKQFDCKSAMSLSSRTIILYPIRNTAVASGENSWTAADCVVVTKHEAKQLEQVSEGTRKQIIEAMLEASKTSRHAAP